MAARRCRRFGSPASELAGPTLVTGRSSSGDAASVIDDDFFQLTRVHVENEASNSNILRYPRMRPNFSDLRPSALLWVLRGKQAIGAGVASPVSRATLSFSCLSVKVVNPQPV